MSLLIENGSDVNAVNNVGGTTLTWAVIAGSVKIAIFLLTHRADVDGITINDVMTLGRAVGMENEDIIQVRVDHGADVKSGRPSSLYTAIGKLNESIMRIPLKAEAIPDVPANKCKHLKNSHRRCRRSHNGWSVTLATEIRG